MNLALIIICIAASHFVALFSAKKTKDEVGASILSGSIGALFAAVVMAIAVAVGYSDSSQMLSDNLAGTLGTLLLVAAAFGIRGWQVSLKRATSH